MTPRAALLLAAEEGEAVHATAPGEVLYAGDTLRGYGNTIILRHDQRTTSLYAHNSELKVRKGDRVRAGQKIASVGTTGRSTGPHLHFEIRRTNKTVDPRKVLPKSGF